MTTFKTLFCGAALSLMTMVPTAAYASHPYGPQDAGRRFSDGSVVKCRKVEVRRSPTDSNRIAGTVAGAVIGGLLGNQVGAGDGKKVATVGGAVAGAAVGRHIEGKRQEAHGTRIVETRCERVYR